MPQELTGDNLLQSFLKTLNKDDKGNKIQSHGLTQNEMKEIKEHQMRGDVEMISGNKVSKYKIPAHEKNLIHFSTERVLFAEDGTKISKPRYHVKTVEDYERMSQTEKKEGQLTNPEAAFAGMRVVILHDPRTGAAEQKKEAVTLTTEEKLQNMSEESVREFYASTFGEEALPSDSKKIMIALILEKLEEQSA